MAKEMETGKVQSRVTEQMNYFQRPEVNVGEQRKYWVKVLPRAHLDITSTSQIQFNVEPHLRDQIDLKNSYLEMEVSFGKVDGTVYSPGIPANDGTALHLTPAAEYHIPANGFFHTQWSNVSFTMNGTPVVENQRDQAYRAMMRMLQKVQPDMFPVASDRWMYTREEAKMLPSETNPYKCKTRGELKRWRRIRRRNKIQLAGPIMLDFWMDCPNYILNGVGFELRLDPATDKFRFLISDNDLRQNYKYTIHSAVLNLLYVTTSPSSLKGIEAGLSQEPVLYPYVRTDLQILPLHEGIREIRIPDLFNKQLPLDLTIAMVDRDSYNGDFGRDPFFFKRNKLETATFYLDNVPTPEEPYRLNTQDEEDDEVPEDPSDEKDTLGIDETFLKPLKAIEDVTGIMDNGFTFGSYRDGRFIVCIKTDPTVPPTVPYWGVPKTGNTNLYLRFAEPLPGEQELLLFARYPALVTIDKGRKVTVK